MDSFYTIASVTHALKGELSNKDGVHENSPITSFSIDSRTLKKGEWFFCISGERTNGHCYITQAIAQGAAGIIAEKSQVSEDLRKITLPWIWVENCNKALRDWATFHRSRFKGKVFAITGSNGKTSTKEILAGLCKHISPKTHATAGNFNNFIGVPLTLLSAALECDYWVVELGSNKPGEIQTLSLIAQPDCALITSIGSSHFEFFKDTQAVALEKCGILKGLSSEGTLVCPANILERKIIQKQLQAQKRKAVFCAFAHELKKSADVIAELLDDSEGRFILFGSEFQTSIQNSLFRNNLLCALVCLHEQGVSIPQLQEACATLQVEVSGRFQEISVEDWLLINDTYNANPSSFDEVLRSIIKLYPHRRLIVVAGAMAELGTRSHRLHCETGAMIAQAGAETLFVWKSTSESAGYCEGWIQEGNHPKNAIETGDLKALIQHFKSLVRADDVVLVKGSRSAQMECFVEYFTSI